MLVFQLRAQENTMVAPQRSFPQFHLQVTSTSIVHAMKSKNVRAYIMGSAGVTKKFIVEVSRSQTQKYLSVIKEVESYLQGHVGKPLQEVKALAKKKKQELLR